MRSTPMHPSGDAIRLQLFGPPQLVCGDRVVRFAAERRFQLLAVLALSGGQWVMRDRIAGLLWPRRPDEQARRNLRNVILRLRDLPGLAGLEVSDHGLCWTVVSDAPDLTSGSGDERFDPTTVNPGLLLAGMDESLNPAWTAWLDGQRQAFAARWRKAALAQLERLETPAARIELAQRMLQVDPLDEDAVSVLICVERDRGAQVQAQRIYRDYSARLAEDLGVEPSSALQALLSGAKEEGAPVLASVMPRGAGMKFVGRRLELLELCSLFFDARARFVTLLGPGGIGKSRLAREVLPRLAPTFPDGVYWVELQDIPHRAAALARVAERLQLNINDAGDALVPIKAWLRERRALIIFDNAEHLEDSFDVFEAIVAAGPATAVLVTSRRRTARAGEVLMPLAGMACPDDDSRDLEAAASFDAVRLFELRARMVQPSFDLARHLDAVISAVEVVGGMPLAIELAAAWVRLLPVDQIADDLRGSLDLLERDPSAVADASRPEHASLRAVVERSFHMLVPREREALEHLSVFVGRFTHAGARHVANASMPLLSSLVDKGLIAADGDGRFGLHAVIAAFAGERLGEHTQREADVRRRHAEHLARTLAALEPHARGDQRLLLAGMTAAYADARAAWIWSVRQGRIDLIDAMVRPMWRMHEHTGRFAEGIALLGTALALPEHDPVARRALAQLRCGLSTFHAATGDLDAADAMAQHVIALGEDLGDLEAYVGCLGVAGSCLWHRGSFEQVLEYDLRALDAARRHHDRHCETLALGKLAISENSLGRFDEASRHMAAAIAITRETGNLQYRVATTSQLGALYCQQGRWQPARELLEQALQLSLDAGLPISAMFARRFLGAALVRLGETEAARRELERAAATARENALTAMELGCVRDLARADIAQGHHASAMSRLRPMLAAPAGGTRGLAGLQATALYGEWLAARSREVEAMQLWQAVLGDARLDAGSRIDLHARRAALGVAEPPADAQPLSADDWAARALAEPEDRAP